MQLCENNNYMYLFKQHICMYSLECIVMILEKIHCIIMAPHCVMKPKALQWVISMMIITLLAIV